MPFMGRYGGSGGYEGYRGRGKMQYGNSTQRTGHTSVTSRASEVAPGVTAADISENMGSIQGQPSKRERGARTIQGERQPLARGNPSMVPRTATPNLRTGRGRHRPYARRR